VRLGLIAILAIAFWSAVADTLQERVELFVEDFSRFPPGMLSAPIGQLNGAIQEYHYIEHRGVRTRPWRSPIVHLDSWAAGDEGGAPYLEQHQTNDDLRFAFDEKFRVSAWREIAVAPFTYE